MRGLQEPRPTRTGYCVDAVCGSCGGVLLPLASGRASAADARATAACSVCGHHFLLTVQLTRFESPEAARRQRQRRQATERARSTA